jgi:hypothetical protein
MVTFTRPYRDVVTDRVKELSAKSTKLAELWSQAPPATPTRSTQDGAVATVASMRDLIEEIRRSLDAAEEILKEDLYKLVRKQVSGS